MLTKYSLLFLLLSTNLLLINSVSGTKKDKGKEKENKNTDQSELPKHNTQQQQQPDHGKDKAKKWKKSLIWETKHFTKRNDGDTDCNLCIVNRCKRCEFKEPCKLKGHLPTNAKNHLKACHNDKHKEYEKIEEAKMLIRTRSSKKVPTDTNDVDMSEFRSRVQQFTGMTVDATQKPSFQFQGNFEFGQQKNIQRQQIQTPITSYQYKPSGTVSVLTGLPEQIPYEQPMINFQFHQQNMQRIQPNVGMQSKISNEFYGIGGSLEGSNRFADRNQRTGQLGLGKGSLPEEIVIHQQHGIGGVIPGSGEGSTRFTSGNQVTGRGTTFSDQLGKGGFSLNFGSDSSGQIFEPPKQQGIGGSSGIPKSVSDENQATGQLFLGIDGSLLTPEQIARLHQNRGIEGGIQGFVEKSNRFVGGNRAMGQIELEKGEFILNSAEPFITGIQQQYEFGGSSGIHRLAGNAEGFGSGKYSYNQIFGNPIGNIESNKELDGSEYNRQSHVGTTQQLSHKTNETIPSKIELHPRGRGCVRGEIFGDQIFGEHFGATPGLSFSGTGIRG